MGELFSLSTLIILLIIVISVYGLFTYFNNKITEQQHAIKGMFEIVKTLADKIQIVESNIHKEIDEENLEYATQLLPLDINDNLMSVSDGGDNNDDTDNDTYDNFSNEDDEEDEEEDDEEDEEEDEINNYKNETQNNVEYVNNILNENTKIVHLNEPIDNYSITDFDPVELNLSLASEFNNDNNININKEELLPHLEEDTIDPEKFMNNSKQDYKKMSLNKLRELAVEKGLVSDASKLKKNDILNLLDEMK